MSLKHLNILLADDDPDDCLFFKEALSGSMLTTHLTTVPDGEYLMEMLNSTDAISDVPEQLQKALAERYRGPVPEASYIEDWQDDVRYRGGWWLWLNIDVDGLTGRGRSRRKLKAAPDQVAAS